MFLKSKMNLVLLCISNLNGSSLKERGRVTDKEFARRSIRLPLLKQTILEIYLKN